jgi:hypothetical protein
MRRRKTPFFSRETAASNLSAKKTAALFFLLRSSVARFFSVQHTKTGNNIPNDNKMYQMATKYTL